MGSAIGNTVGKKEEARCRFLRYCIVKCGP